MDGWMRARAGWLTAGGTGDYERKEVKCGFGQQSRQREGFKVVDSEVNECVENGIEPVA